MDAFAEEAFGGNPAGVVLLPAGAWPGDGWLQRLAAEVNLSETAFAKPTDAVGEGWALRWLTPNVEVDLCGHATLATAHLIAAQSAGADGGASGERVLRFATRSGELTARVAADGAVTLDFPANPPVPALPVDGLAEALGSDGVPAEVLGTYRTGALGDVLVELADEAAVRTLAPDHRALRRFAGVRGFIVTAAPAPGAPYDFVSRWFGAGVDIGEDPVTGSAHTALAPFWSERLGGRTALTGRQVSARGGTVAAELAGDRVLLTGRAVTVTAGELTAAALPPES